MAMSGNLAKTVLITDAGRGSSIAFIRAFGRRGWRVIAADVDRRSPGMRSRYVSERLIYKSPVNQAQDFIETLLATAKEKRVDLIVPVTDEAILPLVSKRDQFEEICQLAIAGNSSLKATMDKYETVKLAERLGIPVPETRLVRTIDEVREQSKDMNWPIVLKPIVSRRYLDQQGIIEKYNVGYANDLDTLLEEMERMLGHCPVILQSYCPGVGQGVEILSKEGRLEAAFQHQRICEYPPSGGASALRESVSLDPQLLDYSSRLVDALGWTGLIMIEFKGDDQSSRLMEINGRIWGSLPLAVASGMDFPSLLADHYANGRRIHEQTLIQEYSVGVKAVNLSLMLLWLGRIFLRKQEYEYLPFPSRRQGFAALLSILDPGVKFDVFLKEDPKPGLAELGALGRKSMRSFIKQL